MKIWTVSWVLDLNCFDDVWEFFMPLLFEPTLLASIRKLIHCLQKLQEKISFLDFSYRNILTNLSILSNSYNLLKMFLILISIETLIEK